MNGIISSQCKDINCFVCLCFSLLFYYIFFSSLLFSSFLFLSSLLLFFSLFFSFLLFFSSLPPSTFPRQCGRSMRAPSGGPCVLKAPVPAPWRPNLCPAGVLNSWNTCRANNRSLSIPGVCECVEEVARWRSGWEEK